MVDDLGTESAAIKILDQMLDNRPDLIAESDAEYQRLRLSHLISRMREESGLTQQQLAERIGTRQSVISRYERESYTGLSLNTLVKLASAMGYRVRVELEPASS
ncbi:MAG: hypothetical protein MAG453_01585 [Calditrichaeota bacterium]|nr:hypothetical protein [Calditrichota bacterium]